MHDNAAALFRATPGSVNMQHRKMLNFCLSQQRMFQSYPTYILERRTTQVPAADKHNRRKVTTASTKATENTDRVSELMRMRAKRGMHEDNFTAGFGTE